MQELLSFLKLGSHWTLPRDCTVGTSLGGTTRGILEGFSGRVLSRSVSILLILACMVSKVPPGGRLSMLPCWSCILGGLA